MSPPDGKLHLLVVDDDEIHRELMSRLLGADYELHEAETGDQALEYMDRLSLQCVLLDNLLPDYTGVELLPMIAERGLPVLMMTSLTTDELVSEASAGGCVQILQKDTLTREALRGAIVAATGSLSAA